MKLFDKYETKDVKVEDPSLKPYITLGGKLVPKSHGRNINRFEKGETNILERIVSLMCVPGHRGKKQRIQTNWASGKYNQNMKRLLKALDIVKEKTGENPLKILVKAIENSAPRDETTTVQYGGARYPQAVDISPLRRINLALRNLVHGGYDKAFKKKPRLYEALAEEIMKAADNSKESNAITKKEQMEKQADSAR